MGIGTTVTDGLATVGNISGIFSLIAGIFVGLFFTIIGIMVMVKRKDIAGGFILIFIGVIAILIGFVWYYFATYNKTTSMLAGIVTIGNMIDGGSK
jgi:uncharacterized membrane protein (UPF0136 family)